MNVQFKIMEELFFNEVRFLLSWISKHEMLRMGLVMADGSSLTVGQHQQQTKIL